MVPSCIWNRIAHIRKEHGFIIIGCGDWKQLRPPEEEDINVENSDIIIYIYIYLIMYLMS